MILLSGAVVLGWTGSAAAHRRHSLPLLYPSPPPVSPTVAPETQNFYGPPALNPESYWKRLLSQEKAGQFQEAWKTGLALANIFPHSPQRGPALLKLAEMAKSQGKVDEALELFSFAAALTAGSQEASQARLAASALELARNLQETNPVEALRRFLLHTKMLPPGYSPELMQEALRTGWQAVRQMVQATSPLPLSLVEDILALWDLQPQGVRPTEASRLLADLLRKEGLCEEARALLDKTADKEKIEPPPVIRASGLEQSWLSRSCPGFPGALGLSGGFGPPRYFWPVRRHWWQVSSIPSTHRGDALLSWLLPQTAYAAWLEDQVAALDQGLRHTWASPLPCQFNMGAAHNYETPNSSPRATRAAQVLEDGSIGPDPGPFHQDRLGLNHLENGRLEAAQAAFQEMAQNNDPFWQRLAQVRLADLELSRLQAEIAP
jgi:tetratricopeptide (TPR) repeat protein